MCIRDRIYDALIGPSPGQGEGQAVAAQDDRPIVTLYVQRPRYESSADEAFYNLLTTHLVERGFVVTTNPSAGYPVSYDMQVVTDRLPETTRHEVILNVSVMNAERFLIRYSNVYYIGDRSQ